MAKYNQQSIELVISALKKYLITNPFVQIGILGTIGKETAFVLTPERGYGSTDNARIRKIFGSRLADVSEDALTALKKDDVRFFDKVYGGRFGNTNPGDGYKFRGRGYQQLTFKDNYRDVGSRIGIDLVSNPDRLNEPAVAAAAAAVFYKRELENGKRTGKMAKLIGVSDTSQVRDVATGVKLAATITAGWKDITNDYLQNIKKAQAAADEIIAQTKVLVKKNPGSFMAGAFFLDSLLQVSIIESPSSNS